MKKFREKASANYQIRLRPTRDVRNAFLAYETSWETERLESERNRQIYSELIDLGHRRVQVTECNTQQIGEIDKTDSDSDDDDERIVTTAGVEGKPKWWTDIIVEAKRPRKLVELAAERVGKTFKGGQMDSRIECQDFVDFGWNANIELPVLDLLELENEIFWKRLVESKIKDTQALEALSREKTTVWKEIGIELKLAELIENLEESDYNTPGVIEFFEKLTTGLNPIIKELSIKKLQKRTKINRNNLNPKSRIVNVPLDECCQGSLEFLGRLTNLQKLSVNFNPGELGRNYKRKLFQVCNQDVENLAKALMVLENLQSLTVSNSDLRGKIKISSLLTALHGLKNLQNLELSYCNIDTGDEFETLLMKNCSLKSLELKGNNTSEDFCSHLANALSNFKGKLKYLGLSQNPIFGNGLQKVLAILKMKNNIIKLNISGCETSAKSKMDQGKEDIWHLTQILRTSESIREIVMNTIKIESSEARANFTSALEENYQIDEIECNDCGFTVEEMLKIKVLLLRNKYYKDNPILRKEDFSEIDEKEIEKFLTRTKHPLLLKHKKLFSPTKTRKIPLELSPNQETTETYTNSASSVKNDGNYYFR